MNKNTDETDEKHERVKAAIIRQINLLRDKEDLHDFGSGINFAIEEYFTHTQTGLDLTELFADKVREIEQKCKDTEQD